MISMDAYDLYSDSVGLDASDSDLADWNTQLDG